MPKKKVAETKKKTPDLTAILGEAEKDQKGSALVELDTESLTKSIPHISTGSLAIDYLIGGKENTKGVRPCPGIPRGKITNIYGLAGSGKTTVALHKISFIITDIFSAIFPFINSLTVKITFFKSSLV